MHLAHPSLSMGGKKKGKVKFRNADEARKARELDESWKTMQQKWGVNNSKKTRKTSVEPLSYSLSTPVGRETQSIKSVDTGHTGAVSSKPNMQYTGSEMLGVTILHKSCLQPIFNQQAAKDAANMRR